MQQEVKPIIHVLDLGYIRLIDRMGNDLAIVRAARASYDASWRAGEDEGSDVRLMGYLYRNRHTSPFEVVEFQFEVYAPIYVFRQWHRHRTWTYNELSARYKELPAEWYLPSVEAIGVQSTNNKQARELVPMTHEQCERRNEERALYNQTMATEFATYRKLLNAGWPRELARGVLGTAVYSHMFAKVDLHNLFHFLNLRDDAHAQFEVREYARAMARLIQQHVPVAFREWIRGRLQQRKIAAYMAEHPDAFAVTTQEAEDFAVKEYPRWDV